MKIVNPLTDIELIPEPKTRKEILVSDLLPKIDFEYSFLFDDADLDKVINRSTILRPQFALMDYFENFFEKTVLLFGKTEAYFLNSLSFLERKRRLEKIALCDVPCIVISNYGKIAAKCSLDDQLFEPFRAKKIPILCTSQSTYVVTYKLMDALDEFFAPHGQIFGNLVNVFNIGVLLIGEPGVGKSELTLDLIRNGHSIVADDLVLVTKRWFTTVYGKCPEKSKNLLEVRGIGIIDVQYHFGLRAVSQTLPIEVIVYLLPKDEINIEHLRGKPINEQPRTILGVEVPMYFLPIISGKDLVPPIETIALMVKAKKYGYRIIPDIFKSQSLPESTKLGLMKSRTNPSSESEP